MEFPSNPFRWLPLALAVGLMACSQDRASLIEHGLLSPFFGPPTTTDFNFDGGPEPGIEQDVNGLNMKFVWCPPGEFIMGSPEFDDSAEPFEKPQVLATLNHGFWLGKFEVTQEEWEHVMRSVPWRGPLFFSPIRYVKRDNDCAAPYISWEDALAFCQKLTELERKAGRLPDGWEYTLPTEAQWEYACRAGTKTVFSFGDDVESLGDYARWGGLVGNGNTRLNKYASYGGLKQANPWGFYDMHGNVMEWCRDALVEELPGGNDPVVLSGGEERICRGGSWDMSALRCRSAYRGRYRPDFRDYSTGFRVAICRTSTP
jgi:formylglycine-generating enzyme required for sulfatase activity